MTQTAGLPPPPPGMTIPTPGPDGFVNDPPTAPDLMAKLAEVERGGPPGTQGFPIDQASVASIISGTEKAPTLGADPETSVDLPAGWISPDGTLVTTARVRELNGYDEERMSRVDRLKNTPVYITELLLLGVEDLGGQKPDRKVLRDLLIGDREQLVLGIRKASYGPNVEFELHCNECDQDSLINVNIDEDVPVVKMDEPELREFEVPLRKGGSAKVALINGGTQEAFSEGIGKKTAAEVTTIMLAKSVISINGKPVMGRTEDVQMLSSADRATITDFIAEHNPGPQLNKEIPANCATCGADYPILLGLPNLFRF